MHDLRPIDLSRLSEETRANMRIRNTARVVVFDEQKNIALLHVQKHNYYKLPGGGVEDGETYERAAVRECLEEIGCVVELDGEIGVTHEYFAETNRLQHSYAYVGHVVGEKGTPTLDEGEIAMEFATRWLPLDDAIAFVRAHNSETLFGEHVPPRELVILEAVKARLFA